MPSNQKEQRESQPIPKQIDHLRKQPTPQGRVKVSELLAQEREQENERDVGLKKEAHSQV